MSLRKGDRTKKAQKHQNKTAFKAGLHAQRGKKEKEAASVVLAGLCLRCKEKLEWKLKYDKYRPLTVPKKCILCQGRTVKQAYYQICRECSEAREVCAKCGKAEDIVERYPPSTQELARDEAQFKAGLKKMTERERRTFLREHFGDGAATPTCTTYSNSANDIAISQDAYAVSSSSNSETDEIAADSISSASVADPVTDNVVNATVS